MKKLIITALVSFFAIGTASADYASDVQSDIVLSSSEQSVDFSSLPATAAGKSSISVESRSQGHAQDSGALWFTK